LFGSYCLFGRRLEERSSARARFLSGTDDAYPCRRHAVYSHSYELEPMSERLTLPVLPLRDVVLFPGVSTPIGAGRPSTLRAIEAALKTDGHHILPLSAADNTHQGPHCVLA